MTQLSNFFSGFDWGLQWKVRVLTATMVGLQALEFWVTRKGTWSGCSFWHGIVQDGAQFLDARKDKLQHIWRISTTAMDGIILPIPKVTWLPLGMLTAKLPIPQSRYLKLQGSNQSSGLIILEMSSKLDPAILFQLPPKAIVEPLYIHAERWLIAERVSHEILSVIQPTVVSEKKRMEVQQTLWYHECVSSNVFPFGSVPLKSYLTDGDIDLTAISYPNDEEDLARRICSILEAEEKENLEFRVENVQYIHAQVKIVKCTVQRIAVDISFNQIPGLYSLCFLEQVDHLIGKDHLFKRSIILIKAWCYYESRILGANHGLISTYALEMLILYIINRFHSSLESPLTVLYSFLTYYSMFNWDKYCISLDGPVAISSLPEIVVETPASYGCDLLVGKEFLKSYIEFFSSPTMAFETKDQPFAVKHLNIIDPLRNNSNLGRSVGEGNFYRIRSALSYGARKLREILMHPKECIGEELMKFFVTTLDRNGRRRPDVQVPFIRHDGQFTIYDLSGDYRSYLNGLYYGQKYHNYKLPTHALVTYPCLVQNKSPCMQFYMDDWTPARENSEPKTQAINKTSSQKVEEVEETLSLERDKIGSCFNLSLEEFPLLPSSKKAVLLENNLSIQAKTGSPEAQNARAYNLLEFGSLGHPSMRSLLSSPVAIELPKSGLLNTTTKETMPGSLTTASRGPENSSECID
ncbi:hypothetical protein RJ640_026266, partial [Escallonia rubra]